MMGGNIIWKNNNNIIFDTEWSMTKKTMTKKKSSKLMVGCMTYLYTLSYKKKINQHHRITLLSGKALWQNIQGKCGSCTRLQLASIITSAKQAKKTKLQYERTKTQGEKIGSVVLVLANRVSQLHRDTRGKRTQSDDVTAPTKHAWLAPQTGKTPL